METERGADNKKRQKRIIAEEHIAQEYSKHRENKKQESDISIDTDSYEL
jgi:hypothetical protein